MGAHKPAQGVVSAPVGGANYSARVIFAVLGFGAVHALRQDNRAQVDLKKSRDSCGTGEGTFQPDASGTGHW